MCSDVSACSDSYGVVLSPAETLFDIPRQTPVVDVLADGLWHGDGPRIRCHHALRWRDWMVHLCTKKRRTIVSDEPLLFYVCLLLLYSIRFRFTEDFTVDGKPH